jgi:large subunit ribosomal protein L21e
LDVLFDSHEKSQSDACAVLNRVKSNAQRRREAKEKGESVQLKRLPVGPRGSRVVEFTEVESLAPQPYDTHI